MLSKTEATRARELMAELQALVGRTAPASAPKKAKVAPKSAPKKAVTKKAAPKGRTRVVPEGGIPHMPISAPDDLVALQVKGELKVKGSMRAYNSAISGWGGSFKAVKEKVNSNGHVEKTYDRRPTQSRPNPDKVRLVVCTQEKWIKRTR